MDAHARSRSELVRATVVGMMRDRGYNTEAQEEGGYVKNGLDGLDGLDDPRQGHVFHRGGGQDGEDTGDPIIVFLSGPRPSNKTLAVHLARCDATRHTRRDVATSRRRAPRPRLRGRCWDAMLAQGVHHCVVVTPDSIQQSAVAKVAPPPLPPPLPTRSLSSCPSPPPSAANHAPADGVGRSSSSALRTASGVPRTSVRRRCSSTQPTTS